MTLPKEKRDVFKEGINQLRHQLTTLDLGLDQGDIEEKTVIEELAKCRATINGMLAETTREETDPESGDGPAWKSAAAKLTDD